MSTWNSWYPKGTGKGNYKGGGKGIKGLTDYTMTSEGQQLTFPPLGNLNNDGWNESNQHWAEEAHSGSWPIGQVVKMKNDIGENEDNFKSVANKRKYSKTKAFDASLHVAMSKNTKTKNRFNILQRVKEETENDLNIKKYVGLLNCMSMNAENAERKQMTKRIETKRLMNSLKHCTRPQGFKKKRGFKGLGKIR